MILDDCRTEWVLALRELGNAHAGVGKAEENLNKELAKLESAAQVCHSLLTFLRLDLVSQQHLTQLSNRQLST